MNGVRIGPMLRESRLLAGLTQAQVAERMGTTQSVVSRAEAGWIEPSLSFIERFARATGRPIVVRFGDEPALPDRRTRRQRVRRALGDYVFDPWDRAPTAAEARSLEADGLTRESFQKRPAARSRH